MTRFLTTFRALFAAGALVLLLGGGVALAAAHAAGTHGNASHQHNSAQTHAPAHGAAGSASQSNQGNHGGSNDGRRDHGSSAQGAHPANHGEFVSRAAHDCGHGKGDVHGDCVSAVAKSAQGK
ncbi:MAG TPA: hypothetical protein VGR57_16815 [Ktedonobacterales bacterium]|nr:hypothetical protein [Ktedonobacterales bacterium]